MTKILRTILFSTLLLGILAAPSVSAAEFEEPPVLKAADLVDAKLLEGPNYKLDPEVKNDGYMNHFTVHSDFGDFTAASELLLEMRIQEVYALAKLAEMSQSEAFVDALGAAAGRTVEGVANVVTDPVGTAKGLGSGIDRMFKGYKYKGKKLKHQGEDVVEEEKEKKAAKKEAADGEGEQEEATETSEEGGGSKTATVAKETGKSLIGWNGTKRRLSQSLDVDPYTDNEVLQEELNRVAKAAFVADLGVRFGVPSIPGMNYVNKANQMVWTLPPDEIERLNDVALNEAGVDNEVRLDFFANSAWPITYETLFVQSLSGMDTTKGRQSAVELAVTSDSRLVSYIFALEARVLLGYHKLVEPIVEIRKLGSESDGYFLVGIAKSGKLIVPIAFDYAIWREEFSHQGPGYDFEQREVWSVGRVSERCRSELEERGWKVNTQVLIPWNEQLAKMAEADAAAAEAEAEAAAAAKKKKSG